MRLCLTLWMACAAAAQSWEIGGVAAGALARSASIAAGTGGAAAGFETGAGAGAAVAHDMYPLLGGEIRYEWLRRPPRLSAGSTRAGFSGEAHALHYDVLAYGRDRRARVRPYALAGGGLKLFRGTGRETAYRPLMEYAWLTRASEWKPLALAGAGLKIALGPRCTLRVELVDQISAVPKAVITPAPGARMAGWVHDLIPAVVLSWRKP
ncbi:MAG: hypothetical protein ACE15B_16365 [Bryobacteraceae bacterium]